MTGCNWKSENNILLLFLYNTGIFFYRIAINIAALFNEKAKLFLHGRKNIFTDIEKRLQNERRERAWIHCASLGEFEQGRPLIELIKQNHPETCIILTFFSPSGYEVRKNYTYADYVFYLPVDTKANAKKFIEAIRPMLALFVKYEFWYHYLHTLHSKKIPAILFSAIFQQRQPFFKWYGGLHREMLHWYRRIFVQDEHSKTLLSGIGIENVSIAGDTRFDRVKAIIENKRNYKNIEIFKGDKKLLIAGSTWKDDEMLLQQASGAIKQDYKLLIVPHEVYASHIEQIRGLFGDNTCLWKDDNLLLQQKDVCIVNEIGHLAFLFRYADAAWIGGGFNKSGIHNIVEPAVYGIPVFLGPNYKKFREAGELINIQGADSVKTAKDLVQRMENKTALLQMGNNAANYVNSQSGATQQIYDYLMREKCFFNMLTKS